VFIYFFAHANRMRTLRVKFPPLLLEEMDRLVSEGWYSTRSALIREAVRLVILQAGRLRIEKAIVEDLQWGLGST
jgi:Arc/MetJ-type ribon-helix-helix transcriptional regulator